MKEERILGEELLVALVVAHVVNVVGVGEQRREWRREDDEVDGLSGILFISIVVSPFIRNTKSSLYSPIFVFIEESVCLLIHVLVNLVKHLLKILLFAFNRGSCVCH